MTDTHIQTYQHLLTQFAGIPPREQSARSFLEIAGFPNYENVISNVLAYFFDCSEVHNLRDLLVKSVLAQAGQAVELVRETVVEREVYTENKKRIDLVIQTEKHLIVIENKIFAQLYNDLGEYAGYADALAKELDRTPVKIILSPFPVAVSAGMKQHQFVAITYAGFFAEIRSQLGHYIKNVHLDSLAILRDFMSGIEKIYTHAMQNKALYDFFTKNQDQIENLFAEYQEGQKGFITEISTLKDLITLETDDRKITQFIWRKILLAHDITLPDGSTVCAEILRRYGGWQINVFARGKNFQVSWNPELLKKLALFEQADLESKRSGNKVQWEVIPEHTDLPEIAGKMKAVLSKMKYKR